MNASWLAASATVCATVLAALFAYINTNRVHQAQERLKWINAQLGEFYGPLYSIALAGEVAWKQFRIQVRPEGGYLFDYDLTEDEKREWTRWMSTVIMPANRRMYEIIVTKSHLLVGDEMPPLFLRFCAHVASYEVLIKNWEQNDYSIINSQIKFPQGYREQISETFLSLKRQQQDLLQRVEPSRRRRLRSSK
ncbi:hypothetical protein FHS29_006250 [Saccharothrix tamanrassetensis]|uniref:Uncharacterized protein n=1 Tax=Saccharothrix tamanrassetensis TaxID=1051531 RepID=A0A841CQQ9_9PSEU|nr:hypothetical protein [Saccharothrix tamanrassetensis]MBB5959629.1 hypothetical protein [Saccharothrix tamanrassetensis]